MKRVYMNIDVNTTTVPFLNQVAKQKTVTREMLYPYVDIYRNTAVTDILLNIFGQSSTCASKYWDSYADIYERKEENGIPFTYWEYNGGFGIYKNGQWNQAFIQAVFKNKEE